MTKAAVQLNFRVPQETEALLKTAAKASNQSLTGFVVAAVEEHAHRILDSRSLVPDGYFEMLIQAFDEPPRSNAAMRKAAASLPAFCQQ